MSVVPGRAEMEVLSYVEGCPKIGVLHWIPSFCNFSDVMATDLLPGPRPNNLLFALSNVSFILSMLFPIPVNVLINEFTLSRSSDAVLAIASVFLCLSCSYHIYLMMANMVMI